MKKILLLFGFFALTISGAYAQVGIGTLVPDASAQLDITATDKGVLIPRVTLTSTTQQLKNGTPNALSLLVYSKDEFEEKGKKYSPGYYFWDGAKWASLIDSTNNGLSNLFNNLSNTSSVTYNSKSNTLEVNAGNGLTTENGVVKLGGTLSETTKITLNGQDFVLSGVVTATDNEYNLVVLDKDGKIKKVEKLSAKQITGTAPTSTETNKVVGNDGNGNLTWVDLPEGVSSSTLETGGDLSGKLNNAQVKGIKGKEIEGDPTENGQVLVYDGTSKWVPKKLDASTLTNTDAIGIGGEVTGTLSNTTVAKLGGKELDVKNPAKGQVITYDGTKWVPAKVDASTLSGTSNIGLAGDVTGTLSNTSVTKIAGQTLNIANASNGDVLTYNGNAWEAKSPTTVTGKKLSLGAGLEFPSGVSGEGAVLTATTINIKAGDGIELDNTKGVSVKVKDKSGLEFVDGANGKKELAVKVGNGLSTDTTDGAVQLGGELTKTATITTTDKAPLVINGKDGKDANVVFHVATATTVTPTDMVVIVDKNGKMKKVDPNSIGDKPNYKTDGKPVKTGSKWDDKDVYQVVFDVTFDTTTYAEVTNSAIPSGANIIGVRLVGKSKGQEVFSSARYMENYQENSGIAKGKNYIFAVYGGMAWVLN